MAEDDPIGDGELLSVDGPGGLRGVLAPDGLDPPQLMNVAAIDANSANNGVEN